MCYICTNGTHNNNLLICIDQNINTDWSYVKCVRKKGSSVVCIILPLMSLNAKRGQRNTNSADSVIANPSIMQLENIFFTTITSILRDGNCCNEQFYAATCVSSIASALCTVNYILSDVYKKIVGKFLNNIRLCHGILVDIIIDSDRSYQHSLSF